MKKGGALSALTEGAPVSLKGAENTLGGDISLPLKKRSPCQSLMITAFAPSSRRILMISFREVLASSAI